MLTRATACVGSLMGLALLIGGCSTQSPSVTNAIGRYDLVVDAPPAAVTRAADAVMDDYKFPVESSQYTKIDGRVVAHTAQGTEVQVWVNQADTQNQSKVNVLVGDTGDEAMSRQILEKIKDRSTSTKARIMSTIHGDSN